LTPDRWGWQAHVSDDAHNWAADSYGVTLYRRTPDGGEQIVGFDEYGWPTIETLLPLATPRPGFRIPREAVRSLAEAVKPGPSQGEVKRLEEALAIERERVERLTDRLGELAGRPPVILDVERRLSKEDADQLLATWPGACRCVWAPTREDAAVRIPGDEPCPVHHFGQGAS
jgi:hypothetical protein